MSAFVVVPSVNILLNNDTVPLFIHLSVGGGVIIITFPSLKGKQAREGKYDHRFLKRHPIDRKVVPLNSSLFFNLVEFMFKRYQCLYNITFMKL